MKQEIFNSKYKAWLFDCDGVLVHSEPLNFESWKYAYSHYSDYQISGDFVDLVGLKLKGIYDFFNAKTGIESLSLREEKNLLILKNKYFFEHGAAKLQCRKGAKEMFLFALKNNIRLAVVSAAVGYRLDFTLKSIGLKKIIPMIIPGEECANDQKNYKQYDMAASRLYCQPNECVVFEDSIYGVKSAIESNVGFVCGVQTTYSSNQLKQAGANIAVEELTEFSISY